MSRNAAITSCVCLLLVLFNAGCGSGTSPDTFVQTISPDPNGDPMPVRKKKPPEYGASGEGGQKSTTEKAEGK